MSRVQLALNVRDVDAAVDFYRKLFGVEPAKRRPGYANFAIAVPPLKLVLIEDPDARGAGVAGALNHLGVEVETSAEVGAATQRLTGQGLATLTQDATSCCYAVQDKVWVHDPDGAPWEVYTVLADAPHTTTTTTTTTAAGSAGSGCTTVDGQCVPVDATAATAGAVAREVELTTHGVPVAASAVRSCC
jgi:catechol 2,3-dioxygenase-like lactoylglutathione lyase family enzyme